MGGASNGQSMPPLQLVAASYSHTIAYARDRLRIPSFTHTLAYVSVTPQFSSASEVAEEREEEYPSPSLLEERT